MKAKIFSRITVLDCPTRQIQSQWGTLPYEAWCRKEAERITRTGAEAQVVWKGKLCAVAVRVL